ncbi:N5-glutamine S-adenosyl-L-methionine-dependent methyltransferase [Mycoavidus cysteinexigens]|uniref:Ribosomal protein uL3 glutamine methyltransferase n=1 Tax=Mycoavidus cysteinexigens TaxID=1553431 RepID=A0A2Z6EUQ6_9BURK|nr:50S ribosomal protein L3 N(5)-glutamine methyltransferase [Mycoavidus cysteinexigens]BBE09203.1 N5-glutamine S-adenosyl-L-methionine-dependent methyltransferase [Mycoavidus cysteinexigens]GAM52044.1 protein-N(5)-glutamine methyltransferase PrmB, methylates LSU ribosomal protein L3p [bacterium endosymbiont of Mortierella elongata FMR23-6]GLR02152.1 50S ribosomal protein L3 glutamine methyltransferase [Mycoavidus cysteinexigens]
MTPPFLTVRDLLRYAVSRFNEAKLSFGHGNANAYDEAAYLILHTLHLPLDMLEPFLDARLLETEMTRLLQVIERRVQERAPAAYITQEAWLHGYPFYVDERVIVPRSLIGELLQEKLAPWLNETHPVQTVLDLCTGSGCLAILAAENFPEATVDAVDVSADALAVAQRNVATYDLAARITLYEGDLYAPLPATRRYNLIIANPPYVNEASMHELPAEYQHEPRLALAGGSDGMDIVRQIVAGARRWLAPHGTLIVEIGHERDYAQAAFSKLNLNWLTTSAGDDFVFMLNAADLNSI